MLMPATRLTKVSTTMLAQSRQRVRVCYQHWIFKLPFLRHYRGMVVARTMLFKGAETEISSTLLQHELAHLDQINRYGVGRFYLIYLCDYVSNLWRLRDHDAAYRHIRFEREARELARSACNEVAVSHKAVTQQPVV